MIVHYCKNCSMPIEPSGGNLYPWTHCDGDQERCLRAEPLPAQSPTEPERQITVCSVCGKAIKDGAPFSFTAKSIYCSDCYEPPAAQSPVPAGPGEFIPRELLCEECQTRGIPNTSKFNWPLCDACLDKSSNWKPSGVPAGEGTKPAEKLLRTALSALRSYQYGNSSPDLAEEVADAITKQLAAPTSVEVARKTMNWPEAAAREINLILPVNGVLDQGIIETLGVSEAAVIFEERLAGIIRRAYANSRQPAARETMTAREFYKSRYGDCPESVSRSAAMEFAEAYLANYREGR